MYRLNEVNSSSHVKEPKKKCSIEIRNLFPFAESTLSSLKMRHAHNDYTTSVTATTRKTSISQDNEIVVNGKEK